MFVLEQEISTHFCSCSTLTLKITLQALFKSIRNKMENCDCHLFNWLLRVTKCIEPHCPVRTLASFDHSKLACLLPVCYSFCGCFFLLCLAFMLQCTKVSALPFSVLQFYHIFTLYGLNHFSQMFTCPMPIRGLFIVNQLLLHTVLTCEHNTRCHSIWHALNKKMWIEMMNAN